MAARFARRLGGRRVSFFVGPHIFHRMSIHQFYRFSVWLPVVLPMTVAAAISVWGWPKLSGVDQAAGVLVLSLVYGGIPYAALAVWATWWIGRRSEREIRRLALAAPLLMCAAFSIVAVRKIIGVRVLFHD